MVGEGAEVAEGGENVPVNASADVRFCQRLPASVSANASVSAAAV